MATGQGAFASFSQITESLKDIERGKKETVTEKIDLDGDVREIKTVHTKCPSCGGKLSVKNRNKDSEKELMTIYTSGGVEKAVHLETRCLESHCG